jgi:hypothetical protein
VLESVDEGAERSHPARSEGFDDKPLFDVGDVSLGKMDALVHGALIDCPAWIARNRMSSPGFALVKICAS